jgi:glycosyltransferase involved in cell wall biosynthesis
MMSERRPQAGQSTPDQGDLVCVIPAHNEERAIGALVREITRDQGYPVIVVNDASTDGTAEVARENGAAVLNLAINLGAWTATQAGLRHAVARGYTLVVTLDADGQHFPSAIPRLVEPVLAGRAEVAIGRCIARASGARRLAWRLFRTITRLSISDLTSGFRVYDLKALRILVEAEATLLEFQDIGVLSLLRTGGCRILERDVPMAQRAHGKSRVFYSWLAVAYYLLYTGILGASKFPRRRTGRADRSAAGPRPESEDRRSS